MKTRWKKLGLLYTHLGKNRHSKLISHTANPVPIQIEGNVYRIFFSGRDNKNRSSIGAVDIDIEKRQVLQEYIQPLFLHGLEDSFYPDGVSLGNCYEVDGVNYMLFMGWQNHKNSHWRGDIGRLIVKPDIMTLEIDSKTPLLGSNPIDPVSLSYPWVLKDNQEYKMWYGSTITWDAGNGEMLHTINYASSIDGHNWHRQGLALPYELGKAQAFSRPTVIGNETEGYAMWFSYRGGNGDKYKIGFAYSEDGYTWNLDLDSAGINVSDQGWDSEMIEYPFVFNHDGNIYMLYNGNGYGKTGFGLAICEECV
ncbi:hypothetical protein K4A83_19860 [Spirulina subsalsa FACHB-351]|uniref:Glycosyl hydrolase family 32 N-terminal domain-containing protein n=1 Tax=Spirulina subsalsa FACHB-351 TaxID=234711 RepID=A0ABT3LAH9_9CYAN|nr:hypothetical protein [Spirulina subsalsa]MCW6038511.1 hypothetical protein [Spirulina subsalsa FACHB-351]